MIQIPTICIRKMLRLTTDRVKADTPGTIKGVFMKSSGRIRATSEVNFKSRMDAYVFGEHDSVTNPGDLLLIMSHSEPGDRQGANVDKFEITVNGDQIASLLAQVTRAYDLYMLNEDWLKSPASRAEIPLTQDRLIERDLVASAIRNRPKTPAPRLSRER